MRFADRGFAQVAVPLSFVAVDVRADTGPKAGLLSILPTTACAHPSNAYETRYSRPSQPRPCAGRPVAALR